MGNHAEDWWVVCGGFGRRLCGEEHLEAVDGRTDVERFCWRGLRADEVDAIVGCEQFFQRREVGVSWIGERGVGDEVGGAARGEGIFHDEICVDGVQSVPDEIVERAVGH